MQYLSLGDIEPLLEECERVEYLEPSEFELIMGTGEFYKARYEKTFEPLLDFYDPKQPLIEHEDSRPPADSVDPTDHEMKAED